MVLFNYSTRELTAKIVYYGPGLCGKTTNLQYIFDNLPGSVKGKMLSLATKTDRTLFFDFLPLDLGEIRGMKTRIQLYTVPGQVFYNETRRLVLKGADGVVFVADSQKQMLEANVDSYRNLEENLRVHSMKLSEMPLVLQYNKRDLPNLASIEDLNAAMNRHNSPFYESVATTGIGVQDTLKGITKLVLLHLTKKYDAKQKAEPAVAVVSVPQPAAQAIGAVSSSRGTVEGAPYEAIRASAPATAFDEMVDDEVVDLTEEAEVEELAVAGESEPVDLVEEVEELPGQMTEPGIEREFEIDHSVEEEAAEEPSAALPAAAAVHAPMQAARREHGIPPRLVLGEPHEILLPVEVETPGGVRKLTLAVRLLLSDLPPGE